MADTAIQAMGMAVSALAGHVHGMDMGTVLAAQDQVLDMVLADQGLALDMAIEFN